MVKRHKNDKPFLYNFFQSILVVSSAVVIIMVIIYAVKFLIETPLYRLFDDIAVLAVINMGIMILIAVSFIFAWFHSLVFGVISAIFVIAYTIIESIQLQVYSASAINYITFAISLLFIIKVIIKIQLEKDPLYDIFSPKLEKYKGPDLNNLHL